MEVQAVAGLQKGVHSYRALGGTQRARRVSSCGVGLQPRRNLGLLGGERRSGRGAVVVSCSSGEGSGEVEVKKEVLRKGSAVVVTEAPPLLKTAEPMPMMRPNNGLINVGDAGRIMDRRPKDTWAVRFAVGAYLIDRKYFEPLEL
ncbi:hypothetical protein KC19_1G325000 [Ceratodon purpureus]|uniref:Chlororespiratory reduction 42 n=1 Tax=Ceratodon purpureus TaxID=3225 RepID=A0A8T0JES9_CERPU|nr:hypothetical protein KC19_1G325000 [Ceratodon purpureus]